MNRKNKIILTIIVLMVLLSTVFTIIDYNRVKHNKMPLFTIKGDVIKDGGSTFYYGLGYKVLKCNTFKGDNSIKMGFYNLEYSCDNDFLSDGLDNITLGEIVDVQIIKTEECDNRAKLYYSDDDKDIYIYCLDNIIVEYDKNVVELKEYIKVNSNILDIIINDFMLEPRASYDDGGTRLYSGEKFNILKCNTIDGNKDIYIGNKNMGYFLSFCK